MPEEKEPISKAECRLHELWGELRDLHAASALLEWDQETKMPPAGHRRRGEVLAMLAGQVHRGMTSPELIETLDSCAAAAEPGSLLAAQVRAARRETDMALKIPERLTRELAGARSVALGAWQEAYRNADFSLFAGSLEETVRLRREEAAALGNGKSPYDSLLDRYEPGATEVKVRSLTEDLVAELTPLLREVVECGSEIDESPALGHFAGGPQVEFGRQLSAAIGFDFNAGRLDLSAHPFCIGIHRDDVRMTYRYQEDDFRPFLFGILHECGHGFYEQGLPEAWHKTPLDDSASVGVHESQSRLWENHVGRSRGFWRWALPRLREVFPAMSASVDELLPTLHTVQPSLVRVDADEVSYHLHIAIRFEVESRLISGDLEVRDLPAAWDELYQRYLGVRPANATEGVLQDIHWAHGSFGYFPTYTLGSIMAAQLYAAAGRAIPDLEEGFAAGEFGPLLAWLRENVHQAGQRYLPEELIERATGAPLDPSELVTYLRRKTEAVYPIG
jgi:carboxypeptidase Taq